MSTSPDYKLGHMMMLLEVYGDAVYSLGLEDASRRDEVGVADMVETEKGAFCSNEKCATAGHSRYRYTSAFMMKSE